MKRPSETAGAAIEMLDSAWHRQTPARAERMACMVLTGIALPATQAAVQRILTPVLDEVHKRRLAA